MRLSIDFPDDILKIAATSKITKRDIEMFHDESWKSFHFGVKRSKVKVTVPACGFELL